MQSFLLLVVAATPLLDGLPVPTVTRSYTADDGKVTGLELIKSNGKTGELHHVQSSTGYVTTLTRITNSGKPPFLLVHGFLASSDFWLASDSSNSLPIIAHNAGYDVWLTDLRGNVYSKNHTTLPISSPKYWDFSFHEMAVEDLTAQIDFILSKTNKVKLYAVGHSMGCAALLAMASCLPVYNLKISGLALLGPAVIPPPRAEWNEFLQIVDMHQVIYASLKKAGVNELLPRNMVMVNLVRTLCGADTVLQFFCVKAADYMFGMNYLTYDSEKLPSYLGLYPSGTSVNTGQHLFQIYSNDRFARFDYGPTANLAAYGKRDPPLYDLKKVTAPVLIYTGFNDKVVTPSSGKSLASVLPNVKRNYVPPVAFFGHLDFQYSLTAKDSVYADMLSVFKTL